MLSSTHNHLTTKLPADIFETYAFYKKGTIKIICWLVSNTSPNNGYVVSLFDLRALADHILHRAISVPDEVLNDLRNMIEARDYMNCWYQRMGSKADSGSNETHSHFNVVLRRIYKDLRDAKKNTKSMPRKEVVGVDQVMGHECMNPFECLHSDVSYDENNNLYQQDEKCVAECSKRNIRRMDSGIGSDDGSRAAIKDDTLLEATYIFAYLEQLHSLSSIVRKSYETNAEGCPLVVSALTTRIAYQCSGELGKSLTSHDIHDPGDLKEKYSQLIQQSVQKSEGPQTTSLPVPDDWTDFFQTWEVLSRFKTKVKANSCSNRIYSSCNATTRLRFQDPLQWFTCEVHGWKEGTDGATDDFNSLDAMLSRMYEHIEAVLESSPTKCFSTPILRDLHTFLNEDNGESAISCQLCFGLYLLVDTYKAQIRGWVTSQSSDRHSKWPNPRVQSLRFAGEIRKHLDLLIRNDFAPCGCLKLHGISVASQLHNLQSMLVDFEATSRFDLLVQSPWVSGEHIVEHLMLASSYGFQAWHHGYYVGTVLHTYRALVSIGALEPLPVLDGLCIMFENTVFMGASETPNVYTCFKRWIGGKIKYGSHHDHSGSHKKRWAMKHHRDVSQGLDSKARNFAPCKISLFSMLAEGTSFLDERVVARTMLDDTTALKGKEFTSFRTKITHINSLSDHLARVHTVLVSEFRSPSCSISTPSGGINAMLIYRLCVQVLSNICHANHPDIDRGLICRCIPERSLRACEVYLNERLKSRQGKLVLLDDRRACESCRDALKDVFGVLKWDDVLWER